jgi:hypothetical protein
MAKSNKHAGQFDLRGKKTLRLWCRCCEVRDLRGTIETVRIKREMKAEETELGK